MAQCEKCSRQYEYDRQNRRGHMATKCNSCVVKAARYRRKKKAVDYLGGKCVRCGYDRCIQALQFHHEDGEDKDFSISQTLIRRWEVLKKELNKCTLLCANCHAEEHYMPS